mmetsp:Transcript_12971/g.25597  ORF Transcript_12971/g.25597 Transcript_12971/m.25597 type:complete len:640 (+) Transcript_12971:482-2401(+)
MGSLFRSQRTTHYGFGGPNNILLLDKAADPLFFECCQNLTVGSDGPSALLTLGLAEAVIGQNAWTLFVGDEAGAITPFTLGGIAEPLKAGTAWRNVHRLGVSSLLFIAECHFIVSASFDSTFVVIDSLDGTVVFRSEVQKSRVTGLAWDSRGSNLLILSSDGGLAVWSSYRKSLVSKACLVSRVDPSSVARCPASRCAAKQNPVASSLLWLLGGSPTIVCNAPQRGVLLQFDIAREVETVQLLGHSDLVVGILAVAAPRARGGAAATSELSDGNAETLVVSASADQTLRFWDSYSATERYAFKEQSKARCGSELSCLLSCHLSGHSNIIASGNQDGSVSWWDVDTGFIQRITEHGNAVTGMCEAMATNARALSKECFFVTCSEDGSLSLWLLRISGPFSPQVIFRIKEAHSGEEVRCVAYHLPTELIISGGNDGLVRCWTASDRKASFVLRGHSEAVTCVCSDPSSGFVFSGSDDKRVLLWYLGTRLVRASQSSRSGDNDISPFRVINLSSEVRDICVIEEGRGKQLACAIIDGSVTVWGYKKCSAAAGEDSLHMGDREEKESEQKDAEGKVDNTTWDEKDGAVELVHDLASVLGEGQGEPSKLGSVVEITPSGTVTLGLLIGTTSGAIVKTTLPMPIE